jgi:hypothetical protein
VIESTIVVSNLNCEEAHPNFAMLNGDEPLKQLFMIHHRIARMRSWDPVLTWFSNVNDDV